MPAFRAVAFSAALVLLAWQPGDASEPAHSPQALRQDLGVMMEFIERTHPDLSHSTNPAALSRAVEELRAKLDRPMTQVQAWREMSRLNPQFSDGHLLISLPDWRGSAREYLQRGGALFPYEVRVGSGGEVFVRAALGGGATPLAGARIETISGVPAPQVAKQLLEHVHGDTPLFRADLLSRRWWLYFWKVLGERDTYSMQIAGKEHIVAGSRALPAAIGDEEKFDRQFGLELLPDGVAVLTVASFSWPDQSAFFDFTRKSFQQLRESRAKALIVDVRDNTGGDDDMWIKGIMPYIATKPYRNGSSYRLRIVEGRAGKSENVGDIRRGEQRTWFEPSSDSSLRFTGDIFVRIGTGTYSSAVLFSNAMQDFGFGTLVGVGGAVRATQSGGVQSKTLPNTGLIVYAPRFILVRHSGAGGLLQPSIFVPDDPAAGMGTLPHFLGL